MAATRTRADPPAKRLERVAELNVAVEQAVVVIKGLKPPGLNDAVFLEAIGHALARGKLAAIHEGLTKASQRGQTPANSDAIARALERGKLARSVLEEEEGGAKSSEQIAELLGITRQAVDQRRRSRRLVAWQDAASHWRFPVWQFDPVTARPYPGLDSILAALPGDPWSDMIFFLSNDETLGARPLDFLRSGRAKRAVLSAMRYGRQGA
ncbi:MAG: hypothetical protein JO069_02100 [Verrucomicrobia bacterium]|nr:hypothetical protein [Verrucomicrobiota bacterium]